jgi:hypothetical protein
MRLVENFGYFDDRGLLWEAPKGSVIDGASIPRIAWTAIGGPFEGPYRNASVIHDVACDEKRRPWQMAHGVFYSAMITSGVPEFKALVMYGAVYHFGPRWTTTEFDIWEKASGDTGLTRGLGEPQPAATEENFKKLVVSIEQLQELVRGGDVSLEQVRQIRLTQ